MRTRNTLEIQKEREEERKEKKLITRQDLNPQSVDHEASNLALCHCCSPEKFLNTYMKRGISEQVSDALT